VIRASSAANVWVFADTVDLTTRVLRWNGSRWASFSFPRELRTYAAAVFSRSDVWAFGEIFSASSASSRPYVMRFTGRRWLRVPSPLVPQAASAVAPDDIWTVGPLTGPGEVWAAAHWNGSSWRTLRFPPLPPAVRARRDRQRRHPGILRPGRLDRYRAHHRRRLGWHHRLALERAGLVEGSRPVPDAGGRRHQPGRPRRHLDVRDRACGRDRRPTYLYHYSNGQWSRQRAPALGGQATEMGVLSWSLGASSGWAAANTGTRGLLLRYFP